MSKLNANTIAKILAAILLLMFFALFTGCNKYAYLPNGCRYKKNAPVFNK